MPALLLVSFYHIFVFPIGEKHPTYTFKPSKSTFLPLSSSSSSLCVYLYSLFYFSLTKILSSSPASIRSSFFNFWFFSIKACLLELFSTPEFWIEFVVGITVSPFGTGFPRLGQNKIIMRDVEVICLLN